MSAEVLTVSPGRAVAVSYRLELDGGVTLDVSKSPVWYVQGQDGFPLPLQRALLGKRAGDVVNVPLGPREAFGERSEALVVTLPRAQFEAAEPLAAGERLEGAKGSGTATGIVKALDDATVTVDFNPDLAGATIVAHLRVEEVAASLPSGRGPV